MKSEKIDQLGVALAKAQGEMPTVPMNAVNPFLKNKYADLAEMIKVASPILARNGLSISQQPVTKDGQIGVTTTLVHASGQWIEDTITLPLGDEKGKSLAQVAGSIITYLRRYSYGAIVGLATDEDTDGNQVNKNHERPDKPYAAQPVAEQAGGNAPDPVPAGDYSNVCTDEGVPYAELKLADLVFRFNTLSKKHERNAEDQRKLEAANYFIQKQRGASSAA